ncbi:hypothetical protein OE88DRAFT_1692172 [Heliocybe sulcata]|uniref:Uncharacterized protein n=1 Tax=Heliocybe sulcata TaxID=5364 RepID=A0A5C3NE87_9AGAM|nr:hypothetical protein OE88DRAFT_1692172 [Heliocybe sulcata]
MSRRQKLTDMAALAHALSCGCFRIVDCPEKCFILDKTSGQRIHVQGGKAFPSYTGSRV